MADHNYTKNWGGYNGIRLVVDESEKREEWCNEVLNSITNVINTEGYYNTVIAKTIKNYDWYNGIFDSKDFDYITQTYKIPYPARMRNFPIISPKIDLLIGEYLRRPFNYAVRTINADAISRKLRYKAKLEGMKYLNAEIEELKKSGIDFSEGIEIPQDIEKYLNFQYREKIEKVAQDSLDYLVNIFPIKDTFKKGFQDLCIAGREFYKVYIENGNPMTRRIDPRNIVYDDGGENEYLDDCSFVGEWRDLSPHEIIQEYRTEMTKDQIDDLKSLMGTMTLDTISTWLGGISNTNWVYIDSSNNVRIRVVEAEWISLRYLKFKISENKYDETLPFMKRLPDNYKINKGNKDKIKEFPIKDVWEAVKIGGKHLIRARRKPNQIRNETEGYENTKLSYKGLLYNYKNGRTVSVFDRGLNIQILYNIVIYHIERLLNNAGGKAVVYDIAKAPKGTNPNKVFYHAKADNFIIYDSRREGDQLQGARDLSHFQQIDFTLSNSLQQYINIKIMLEDMANKVTGINEARQGTQVSDAYVGTTQAQLFQSSLITEPLFYAHQECIKRVLSDLLGLCKIAWANGKKASYILGDGSQKILDVIGEISKNDYGIFVSDGGEELIKKQKLEQLMHAALQNDKVEFEDVIRMIKTEGLLDLDKELESSLERKEKKLMSAQQQQLQGLQIQAENEQNKLMMEERIADKNNATKIKIKEMEVSHDIAKNATNASSSEKIQKIKGQQQERISKKSEKKTKK